MYGSMKLVLQNFKQSCLLPSNAVFSKGGKRYVFVVRGGVVRLTPVEVQVNDGVLAKVNLIEKGPAGTLRRPLHSDDLVVQSNQAELSDGQRVDANEVKW
jgi:hypothetical protein